MRRATILGVLGLLAGCGQSRADLCRRQVEFGCRTQLQCGTATSSFLDQADCEAQNARGCDRLDVVRCDGEDLSSAYACVDEDFAALCTYPPPCALTALPLEGCTTQDGWVVCQQLFVVNYSGFDTCHLTATGCTGGDAFTARCDTSGCTCEVNGVVTSSFSETGRCDPETVNARCGWALR